MKFHNITKDDMLNGDGLRVVLWVSGCSHHCKGCQNPITWDPTDGMELTMNELGEICDELNKDYISGVTFSGGDPLYERNRFTMSLMIQFIKKHYPDKTIWVYTGYTWEDLLHMESGMISGILQYVDVLVDGPFVEELKSEPYHWAGSTNQRVIDVQKSLQEGSVILWDSQQSEKSGNSESSAESSRISCDT